MITINPQKNPKALVVWLHGLGADENDFVPFVKSLALDNIEFILPNAPLRPITMNQGLSMRGWYDIKGTHNSLNFSYQDESGLIKSKDLIEVIIKKDAAKQEMFRKFLLEDFLREQHYHYLLVFHQNKLSVELSLCLGIFRKL